MSQQEIDQLVDQDYKYGFVTDIESDTLPPGLNEDVIREISTRKGEPEWLLEWRLEAYAKWLKMTPPDWAHVDYPPIDFQSISYFSAPKKQGDGPQSLDEVDPALIETYLVCVLQFLWEIIIGAFVPMNCCSIIILARSFVFIHDIYPLT